MIAALVATAIWLHVAAYYVHAATVARNPAVSAALRPLLRWRATTLPLLGTAAALLALLDPATGTAAAVSLAGIALAGWRQWAFAGRPPQADRVVAAGDDAVVVVLPSGDGVPRAWLWRQRVARVDGVTLVGCSLARSVAAFQGEEVRRDLPLDAGFSVSGGGRWHGITGASLTGAEPLRAVPVRLASAAQWAAAHPNGRLRGTPPIPPERPPPPVRVPGINATGAEDDPGVLWDGRWMPLGGSTTASGIHLARWAARRLALSGADE